MKIQLDFSEDIDISNFSTDYEWQKDLYNFLKKWYSDEDYIITKTSGSTGKPKEIILKKKNMLKSAKITCDFLGLKDGDKALVCMPTKYIAGKMMLVRAIYQKLNLTVIKPVANPLEDLNENFVFSAMTPMQVENSLNKLFLIKKLLIGGANVSYYLLKKLKDIDTEVYESFGMTETISHIALKNVSKNEEYFKLMPDVKISSDERGCLVIEASHLEEKIITNDKVEIKNDEFRWLGRIDNVINSGGIKLFPESIENRLKPFIDDREFFITSKKDSYLGEKIILIIEGNNEIVNLEQKIKKKSNLNKYEIPKEIIYIEKLEKTPTGKIKRNIIL